MISKNIDIKIYLSPYFFHIDDKIIGLDGDHDMALDILRKITDAFHDCIFNRENFSFEVASKSNGVELYVNQLDKQTIELTSKLEDGSQMQRAIVDAQAFYKKLIDVTMDYVIKMEDEIELCDTYVLDTATIWEYSKTVNRLCACDVMAYANRN